MATRNFSDIQEQHIARVTGGKTQSNSGGTRFGGGDVHTEHFFIEAKTPTTKKSSFPSKMNGLPKCRNKPLSKEKMRVC